MIENELHIEKRKQYLDGKISHDDYYCWIANFIGVTEQDIPFTKEQILNSKDIHLNDLPLNIWDKKHPLLNLLAKQKSLNWSYSNTVCVLKSFARKLYGKPSI